MQSGKGVNAEVFENNLFIGNEKYLSENGIELEENIKNKISELRSQGKAILIIAKDNYCIGIIALSDILRPEAKEVVSKLNNMNVSVILLTGDNRKTAEYFANQAGITNIYAQLLPDEKVKSIIDIQNKGNKVSMIGDGVNDAPALKTADVGIAMGNMGSDIAVEAADIALVSDNISKVPYLKKLSNATVSTIKFSITLSMCINFVAVICSILGILNPTTGALVHNAGSCIVVFIAALLYDRKFE